MAVGRVFRRAAIAGVRMATDLDRHQTDASSNEALVRRRIAAVCRRLRAAEAAGTLLLLTVLVCGYALTAALFDLATGGSSATWVLAVRWTGYGAFLAGTLALLVRLTLQLTRRINPYYAALQLERTLADAKNSLVNWLDLHKDTGVPGAFRKNLSTQAAHDLEESDPEQTLPKRRNSVLLGVGVALLVGLLVLLGRDPTQFVALMQRAFLPFLSAALPDATEITLLRPSGGNAAVLPNQPVLFAARIDGRVALAGSPGAPALRYRYSTDDEYLRLPLQQDADGIWVARLPGEQVRTGFFYRITAGEATTPEYQVEVTARPQVHRFEITYRERPYRGTEPRTIGFPNKHARSPLVQAYPGTQVELIVRTTRSLRQATLDLATGAEPKELLGEILPDDPTAFRCRWVVEKAGQFRIRFTSVEGEANVDRTPYPIELLVDAAPRVALTKPGADVKLPANGTLVVEGWAKDDLGVKALTLQVSATLGKEKVALQGKPYLPDQSLRFDDGTYPDVIEYQDFIALDEMKNTRGEPFAIAAGTVLEYWLEARDNADFPDKDGSLGKSKVFKVLVLPPDTAKKQQAARRQASAAQQKHAKQQSEKHAKQNEQKKGGGAKDQEQLNKLGNEKKDTEQKLKDALDEQKKQEQRGQGKGGEPQPSHSKPGPQEKSEGPSSGNKGGDAKPDEAGAPKEGGQPGQEKQAGNSKNAGPPQPPKGGGAGEKGEGKSQPKGGGGAAKDDGGMKGESPAGAAKGEGPMKSGPPQPPEQGKAAPPNSGGPQAQAKQAGPGEEAKAGPPGEAKSADPDPKAQGKEMGTASAGAEKLQPQVKQGAPEGPGTPEKGTAKETPPEQAKSAGAARPDESTAGAKAKEPTPEDIARLKDQIRQKERRDDAAGALAKIGKNARDPKVRQEARDVLAKNGRDPDTGAPKDGPATGSPTEKTGDGPKTTRPTAGTKGSNEKKEGKSPFGSGRPGSKGLGDDVTADAVNKDFAGRGGELQLDELKRRVTPELLRKAGISEAEWRRYLKSATAYDALARKLRANRPRPSSGAARPSGTRPAQVGGLPSSGDDPLDAGRAPPPPELRDAQRLFSKTPR